MLVYNEFTDMWDAEKGADDYHLDFAANWSADLTSLVRRDRNHASVFVWSAGNEINEDPNNYGPQLIELIRALDPTRPVALGGQFFNGSWDYVDSGDAHYGVDLTVFHDAHPDKPMMRGEDTTSHLYDSYEFDQAHRWMIGTWVWTAWDYIGESAISAPAAAATVEEAASFQLGALLGGVRYPWFQSFSGDIDLIGQRKPQSYWRSVVYGLSPIEMFVERPVADGMHQFIEPTAGLFFSYFDELASWTWDVTVGTAMVVHVYAAGDTVSLLLDGELVATRSGSEIQRRIATFEVPFAPGELTAMTSKDGVELGRTSLVTVNAPAALRLAADVSSLTTDRRDLAHVLIEVVDNQGRLVPDAVLPVGLHVRGAGELIALGNGNPHNVDSFAGPRRHTWHGQALAVVRSAKRSGVLTVEGSVEGLSGSSIDLPVVDGRDGSSGRERDSERSRLCS
jgi:beta-galactosidase